jgi:hypothetical protein
MARTILDQYGPNTPKPQAAPATCGGVCPGDEGPIPYDPPVGPKGITSTSPHGLGGTLLGNDQISNTPSGYRGPFGAGWSNHGNGGSQGKY